MLSRRLLIACAAAVLVGLVSGTAHAQLADYRTYLTFSAPVQLPGKTLPAGKYIFQLPDSNGGRRVIQVLTFDGNKPQAMLLAIPAMRRDPPKDPEVAFMETAAGTPPAIKKWWYPGNRTGWEFIYPRKQALEIAKTAKEPVLTVETTDTSVEEFKTADLTRVTGNGEETSVNGAASSSGSSAVPESTIARADTREPSGTSGVARSRTRLPRTASLTPIAGVVGLLSLVAATAMRSRRRGFAYSR